MVYEVVWTEKALISYGENIEYLRRDWSEKEINNFIRLLENKILLLSTQPYIGSPKNKKNPNVRSTVLHKRVTLIYQVSTRNKKIELILFWNTYQHPSLLKKINKQK